MTTSLTPAILPDRRLSTFGPELRRLRKSSGMSMPELARLIGRHKNTLYMYESGKLVPSRKTWDRLNVNLNPKQRRVAMIPQEVPTQPAPQVFLARPPVTTIKELTTDQLTQELAARGYQVTLTRS